MDPIAISGLLVIVILLAAAAFGIYNRKKGAPVGIKIDPVKRAERQAKRKARRQEIIEGVKAGLGSWPPMLRRRSSSPRRVVSGCSRSVD